MNCLSIKCSRKNFRKLITLFFLISSSCSPTIYYLGNNFEKTVDIDIFYSEKDIKREYTTIGQMTHDLLISYSTDDIKEAMIDKAKEIGGDGILFKDTKVVNENGSGDRISVTADVIKYADKN